MCCQITDDQDASIKRVFLHQAKNKKKGLKKTMGLLANALTEYFLKDRQELS